MKRQKEIMASSGGFSLAETLAAILILLMVSGIVAEGMPVAVKALDAIMETANAQLLLSTTMTALREELSTASDIIVNSDDHSISYKNEWGLVSKISLGGTGKSIQLQQSKSYGGALGEQLPLVSDETASKSRKTDEPVLYVAYGNASFDNTGIIKFTDLEAKRVDNDNSVVKIDEYPVRVVGYVTTP